MGGDAAAIVGGVFEDVEERTDFPGVVEQLEREMLNAWRDGVDVDLNALRTELIRIAGLARETLRPWARGGATLEANMGRLIRRLEAVDRGLQERGIDGAEGTRDPLRKTDERCREAIEHCVAGGKGWQGEGRLCMTGLGKLAEQHRIPLPVGDYPGPEELPEYATDPHTKERTTIRPQVLNGVLETMRRTGLRYGIVAMTTIAGHLAHAAGIKLCGVDKRRIGTMLVWFNRNWETVKPFLPLLTRLIEPDTTGGE
jgi:hypothetical protein